MWRVQRVRSGKKPLVTKNIMQICHAVPSSPFCTYQLLQLWLWASTRRRRCSEWMAAPRSEFHAVVVVPFQSRWPPTLRSSVRRHFGKVIRAVVSTTGIPWLINRGCNSAQLSGLRIPFSTTMTVWKIMSQCIFGWAAKYYEGCSRKLVGMFLHNSVLQGIEKSRWKSMAANWLIERRLFAGKREFVVVVVSRCSKQIRKRRVDICVLLLLFGWRSCVGYHSSPQPDPSSLLINSLDIIWEQGNKVNPAQCSKTRAFGTLSNKSHFSLYVTLLKLHWDIYFLPLPDLHCGAHRSSGVVYASRSPFWHLPPPLPLPYVVGALHYSDHPTRKNRLAAKLPDSHYQRL